MDTGKTVLCVAIIGVVVVMVGGIAGLVVVCYDQKYLSTVVLAYGAAVFILFLVIILMLCLDECLKRRQTNRRVGTLVPEPF